MQQRSILGLALVLVMILPAFVVMPLVNTRSNMISTENIVHGGVQTAGARLSGYTNHVPIIISKAQDFITQGWPGSGTELDPFLISGLNITYDVNLVSINITNTDAHFKIVDCVINQLSSSFYAIYLANVSHASIEYTTLASKGDGIFLSNATSTRVMNTDLTINSSGFNAVRIISSDDVVVQDCVITASSGRAVYLTDSNNLLVKDISFEGSLSYYGIFLYNSNSTSIMGFIADTTFTIAYASYVRDFSITGSGGTNLNYGVRLDNAQNVTISNTNITSSSYGIYVLGGVVSDITIKGCRISSSNNYGIYSVVSTNNTQILNNRIFSSLHGIMLQSSFGVSIIGNTIEDISKGKVMVLSNSQDLVLTDNTISQVSLGEAIYLFHVVNATVSRNAISHVATYAIYADTVNETTVMDNTITDVDTGIYCDTTYQWDIISNTVELATSTGIYVSSSGDFNVSYNTVSNVDSEGIYTDTLTGDLFVVGNDVSQTGDAGIYVSDISKPLVENNTLNQVYEGIYVSAAPNCTVRFNQIWDATYAGINTWMIYDGKILNNTIGAGPKIGIYLMYANNATIFGNTMTECGIYFPFGHSLAFYVLDLSYNTVNGLPVYYALNHNGLTIDGNSYGQIFIVNSTNILVQNGSFINPTVAFQALYSDFITIDKIHVESIYFGIGFGHCNNLTLTNLYLKGSSGRIGIELYTTINVTITEAALYDWSHTTDGNGIYAYYGEVFTLTNLTIVGSYYGIYASNTDNVTLTNTIVKDTISRGIYAVSSEYWEVHESEFLTSLYGIYLYLGSTHWIIDNSKFLYSGYDGIRSTSSTGDYNNVTNCLFEGNRDGAYISSGDYWAFIGNTFRWNTRYGLHVTGMAGPVIYSNTFVGNMDENGYDTGTHYWDNGVDTGNAWDDYSGSGAYDVPGGGGTQDRYPSKYLPTFPIVSMLPDVSYAEGTEHYLLTWYAYDDYLVSWNVTRDGLLYDQGAWNFHNVTVDVGGLAYGDYAFEVAIRDSDGNTVFDTVHVHVYDGTEPHIVAPTVMLAFVGGSNQYLVWNVSDLHPANYSINVDDVFVVGGDWTTGTITFDVSGLTVGDHDVELELRDIDLNQVTSTVLVRMISDTTNPTIDSPSDVTIYAGSSGNIIVWTPSDLYPDRYEITMNGSAMTIGDWNGEVIILSLDGLDVGVYQFTITVYDGAGNSASDSVTVTVIAASWSTGVVPTTTTTTLPLFDNALAVIALAAGAGIVVVIVVLYFLKKRRA
ncbi:MAG: right-handed parallel beta-helix repeat-containing protein [Candidatus Thorarchaeota archaeon]|nr:right-handed parallel beta-helix repeat-containing protein [Candidatus Thorarchaeota archaeon]